MFCITSGSARVRVSRGAPGGVPAAGASPRARRTRASRRAQYRRPPITGRQRATVHQPLPARTNRAPCIVGSNWLAGGESQKDDYAESGVRRSRRRRGGECEPQSASYTREQARSVPASTRHRPTAHHSAPTNARTNRANKFPLGGNGLSTSPADARFAGDTRV